MQAEFEAKQKSKMIADQKRIGLNKQNDFIKKKVEGARGEVQKEAEKLKVQINSYETEA
jgi:hypothetical protein